MTKNRVGVKMAVIKYIDPMSLAKMDGVIGLIVGLIVGILVAAFGSLIPAVPGSRTFTLFFGVASVIMFPIVYGVMGFVGGLITAWVYNFVARKVGGVRLNLG